MTVQALIFDLSAFSGMQAAMEGSDVSAGLDVDQLLAEALEHGLPCA